MGALVIAEDALTLGSCEPNFDLPTFPTLLPGS